MIGVFDSGVGGLSVLKELRAELPFENFVYIADSAHAPYGEREEAYVVKRSRAIAAHLVSRNVKVLVIACNTATAAAIHLLRADYPDLPIIGVEPALKPAAASSRTGRIGVLATRGTLASAKFQALLAAAQSGPVSFTLQACNGLADAIERSASTENTTEIIASCARHISAMGDFGTKTGQIDTLVLGCTHYPFAKAYLQTLVGQEVHLISNGDAIARQTRRLLNTVCTGTKPGEAELLTTGQAHHLQAAAKAWLGLNSQASTLHF